MFYSDEEYEAFAAEGEYRYLYYYVDEKRQKHALEPHGEDYQKATNLYTYTFAPDGSVYAASETDMYRINVETGETDSLFATAGQVESIVFVEDVMLAADKEKVYLYDMADGKLLGDNSVLSDFVASHSNGGFVMAVSDKDIDVKVMSDSAAAENDNASRTDAAPDGSIDGEKATGEQVLYMACRTGLYRYIWGGSVIEQIADGQMTALGDTQRKPLALQVLDNGEFRVFFSGNYMVEMYYDESLPARPSKELSVYSLEENGWIRYAGQLFRKSILTCWCGMRRGWTVTMRSARKTL